MKKSIALYFACAIYVRENPDINLLSTSEKVKVNLVSMIPFAWCNYVSKEIDILKKEFEQSDSLK